MDTETLPPFTAVWVAGAITLTLLEHLGFISEYQLFYSSYYVFHKRQYWRLITTFMYFGRFGFVFLFRVLDLMRFASRLEGQTFGPTRRANYAWLLLCTSVTLLILGSVISMRFMSYPLLWVMIYIWSRKNRHIRLNFMGLLTMTAPYYPFFELVFLALTESYNLKYNLLGILLGHACKYAKRLTSDYFLEELWPREYASNGEHWLRPPQVWYVGFLLSFFTYTPGSI